MSNRHLARFNKVFQGLLPTTVMVLSGGAQTFNSGSTGADGALNYPTPGVYYFDPKAFVPPINPAGDNVFNFTTINIASGVTVKLSSRNLTGPVYWLAQGAVTISGTIDANGEAGSNRSDNATDRFPAAGGAGGYSGGVGGNASLPPTAGNGPGGSPGTTTNQPVSVVPYGGTFTGSQYLIPLIGGSGGGGSMASPAGASCSPAVYGGGGGGGGGAILIASSTSITLNAALISANGGLGGTTCLSQYAPGGSGGAVRLIAPTITTSGSAIRVYGSSSGAGPGRIRIEAYTGNFNLISIVEPVSFSTPFNVVPPATPPSTLKVVSLVVNGSTIAINANPFSFPDASINSANPVTVNVQAQYIPTGTIPKVIVMSETGPDQTVNCTALQGTLQQSTCSAQITFPAGGSRGFVKATWQ